MVRKSYRSSRKSGKTRQSAKRRPLRKVTPKTVARFARREITRMVETQDADNRSSDVLVGTISSTQWNSGAQCFCLTPNSGANQGVQISQGITEGARKGNQIRTVRASISISGVAQGYNATTNPTPKPFFLKWWIVSARQGVPFQDLVDVIAIQTDFFDSGSGTTSTNATTLDLLRPINNEKYVVHKQGTHKMFFSSYTGSGGTGTGDLGQQANNDFKMSILKKINATKYMPKLIRYVDNVVQAPTSKPVWWVCSCYYADGTVMPSLHAPIRLRVLQDFKFKDM